MTNSTKIRMKKKPAIPSKHLNINRTFTLRDDATIDDIQRHFGCTIEELLTVKIVDCWSEDFPVATLAVKESPQSLQSRVSEYERKLEEYNAWYSQNREEIDAELARRQDVKNRKAEARKEIIRLEKELCEY